MRRRLCLAAAVAAACIAAGTAAAAPALTGPPSTNLNCKPLHNTPLLIAFARKTLIYNGFHPNIAFTCRSGYIFLLGVVDGEEYQGAVTRLGPHRIKIAIVERFSSTGSGRLQTDSASFTVPFDV